MTRNQTAPPIPQQDEQPAACLWQLVNTPANDEMWRGDCGILWVFTDVGTPQEHNVKFCPYCGRALVTAEQEEK